MESSLPVIVRTDEVVEKTSEVVETTSSFLIPIWAIVIAALVVVIVVMIVLFLIMMKKNKAKTDLRPVQASVPERQRVSNPQKRDVEESHSNLTKKLWEDENNRKDVKYSRLIIYDIARPEKQYKVYYGNGITIGRKDCDINLDYDKFVSSVHCMLSCEDGVLYVEDLKSSNGTLYKGQKISEKTPIMNMSIIKVGKTELRVEAK